MRMPLKRIIVGAVAFLLMLGERAKCGDDWPTVHEWGTFTALQNENGDALPGINVDDERLPAFCHNLTPWALQPARSTPVVMMKGAPQRHPYVTLRLETPVIYFHPGVSQKVPFTVDVDVQFHGGWLTEFYPQAMPDEPGLSRNDFNFGPITADTLGGLAWHRVQVGSQTEGPQTDEHVWVAPRKVSSANLTVPPQSGLDDQSESERFLFYRGVANRPVPLRICEDFQKHALIIRGQCADALRSGQVMPITNLWLVDILSDGRVAYRALGPITVSNDLTAPLAEVHSGFAENEYASGGLEKVQRLMHKALVRAGLYPDEATAMLETWRRAYFQSPGRRLFFLVPQAWTDAVLPLRISPSAHVNRVMMGRIELISSEQRCLLKKLSILEPSDGQWMQNIRDSQNARLFYEGRSNFGDLGVKIPADYQAYLDLGRFRNALVLAEEHAHPTPQLGRFITIYGLAD